jgi:hypothetical protein
VKGIFCRTVKADLDKNHRQQSQNQQMFRGRLPGPDRKQQGPPEVLSEIMDVDLKQRVEVALAAGILRREELSGDAQIALFAELRQPMGAGEAASLALAIHNGWAIASDDLKAFRHEASNRLGQGRILTTRGLSRTMTLAEVWRAHAHGTNFVERNYREALLHLEAQGKISVEPPLAARGTRTGQPVWGSNTRATFPRQ